MGVVQCCQEPAIQPSFNGYRQSELQQISSSNQSEQFNLQDRKNKISQEIAIDINSIGLFIQNSQKSKLFQNMQEVSKSNLAINQEQFTKTINGRFNNFGLPDKQILLKKLFQVKKCQFKHLPLLKINILKSPQNQIKKTYYLRFDSSFYIGQWKYHPELKSDIPFGIGRLYKNSQLFEGTFKTFVQIQDFKSEQTKFLMREQQNINKFQSRMTRMSRQIEVEKIDLNIRLQIFLDGIGRYITPQGQQYNGQFTKGKLNGKGFYKNHTIDYFYQGSWRSGLRQGKGTQKNKLTFYDGGYQQDKKWGKGTLIFYLSNKQEQQRLEQEKKLNKNHDKYNQLQQKKQITKNLLKIKRIYHLIENQFKNKKEEILRLNIVKTKYQPLLEPWDFTSVCQNQNFIYQHQSRKKFLEKYVGQFSNDVINGNGSYQWNNGKFYNGQWKQGKMQGNGEYYTPFGFIYKGQFKNDKKHGKGQNIYRLNQIYRGSWAFDLKHGYGQTYIYQQNEDDQGKKTAKLIIRGSKWSRSQEKQIYFNLQIQDSQKIQPDQQNQYQKHQNKILHTFLSQDENSKQNKNIFSIDQKSEDLQSND